MTVLQGFFAFMDRSVFFQDYAVSDKVCVVAGKPRRVTQVDRKPFESETSSSVVFCPLLVSGVLLPRLADQRMTLTFRVGFLFLRTKLMGLIFFFFLGLALIR